jgi:hypothetical protein
MVQKIGDYNTLLNRNDVMCTYTYDTPDNKVDVSNEVYVFEDELSYGYYEQDEKTFPQLKGVIEQGYEGKEFS